MKALVEEFVPDEDSVLVVSRGDSSLLEVGRPASHFPQAADGAYLGHHPASSIEAIAQLEALRECGAAFLVFPRTALWWLEHYRGFRDHLGHRYSLLVLQGSAGAVFELRPAGERRGADQEPDARRHAA
jgi:hypothetical protein